MMYKIINNYYNYDVVTIHVWSTSTLSVTRIMQYSSMKRKPENENNTTDNIQTCTGKYAQAQDTLRREASA